jgi:hypothetical protein
MQNQIKLINNKKFDLNNLPISIRGTTAYANVSFTHVDNMGERRLCYIAIAGLNEEEQQIAKKNTFMFHLAFCETALEAAYIANEFDKNREYYLPRLIHVTNGNFARDFDIQIPKFDFDQIDTEKTINKRADVAARFTQPKAIKPIIPAKPIELNNDKELIEIFTANIELFKDSEYFEGANQFKEDIKTEVLSGKMTIEQLYNDYN